MRPWTHWASSADLAALRLPAHDAGTGLTGSPIGRVSDGDEFVFDPLDAYRSGLVTNPNAVVLGAIGAGKSTVVKMILARALARGRRAVVVDPKGEYGELARRVGGARVALGRDGWCDPIDEGGAGRSTVRVLLEALSGRALDDEEHLALDEAWVRASALPGPRLRAVAEVLAGDLPADPGARRALALSLRRLVRGDLAGVLDGEGAPVALDAPLVVLDVSEVWGSAAVVPAALAAVAAAQRMVATAQRPGYVVLDEAWALLDAPGTVDWLRASWKLARARGLSHVVVLHRAGDASAVGDAGSAARERATGLLAECETAVLLAQPPEEARTLARVLGLGEREADRLTRLTRGEALVRYGPHRSLVHLEPRPDEWDLVDTDQAMRAGQDEPLGTMPR